MASMGKTMIEIDGSFGEGGGQILRSSLTLSILTGKDLRIVNVRAKRSKPGLRPQHLTAVRAAAKVCKASTEGASIGSQELVFRPGEISGGKYRFEIGTAGSTSLVLQTIFLPLTQAQAASTVTITGGTHVRWSPSFHYLDWHWLHFLRKMGVGADLTLEQAGFYPQGGGRIRARIHPADELAPLDLTERGDLIQIRGISASANLPGHIVRRQRQRVVSRLGHRVPLNDIRTVELPSSVKGTIMLLLAEYAHTQACVFALGERGKRAETVADEAVDAWLDFDRSGGVVDRYLADQLLLPLALASGPSALHTAEVTQHLLTNAEVIRSFLPVEIEIDSPLGEPGLVHLTPTPFT
jgi:RNA 3'-terminal phosphate cyclase (ATP)